MKQQLENIESAAFKEVLECGSIKGLEDLRVKFLGKKGELTAILKLMGKLSAEERPIIGQLANKIRQDIENAVTAKMSELKAKEQAEKIAEETIDITLPGKPQAFGKLHPLSIVENEIKDIFMGMGFSVADGPEVEYDYYNFEALNLPPDHPARDTQDTFYITDNILLRTQTSSVQVHVMENQKPPIRIISPGRVYRSDAVDATHSPIFHQIEGLVVDKSAVKKMVPLVEGITLTSSGEYKVLECADTKLFSEVLDACRELQNYNLSVDKITCRNDRIYLRIANVKVNLGESISAEKIAQIPPIIEKLGGQEGTLHLENYADGQETITFEKAKKSK